MTVAPETRAKVLVIDDEIQMRRLLRVCLEKSGYLVIEAPSGEKGIEEAALSQPDAVLLDLGLPDMSGLAVLKRLREWTQTPVLVISVRGSDEDKIAALDSGADDFVTKPFSAGELLARIRVARRRSLPAPRPAVFQQGVLEVDLASRTVRTRGERVRLTATEYNILKLFVQNAGRALTHGQILREIWNSDDAEKIGHLRVHIAHLREKLESNPLDPELLITEPGVGYRLGGPA
jgi:two-component system KDP operon response regulator KdpE